VSGRSISRRSKIHLPSTDQNQLSIAGEHHSWRKTNKSEQMAGFSGLS
jgi:hypothetical protein